MSEIEHVQEVLNWKADWNVRCHPHQEIGFTLTRDIFENEGEIDHWEDIGLHDNWNHEHKKA